jgi:EAL domain-containing protein (putative c-di-GMP-specific phosphodiesterase class I)
MKICFEITESIAISNLRNTLNFMENTKLTGVKFALDDFGSGFSSYGYLKTLPVDYIKIDGHFICNIISNRIDYTMVKSITEIAHAMNIDVVAEFVENEAIYLNLKELGVNFVQGYYIGKPQSLLDF